MGWTTVASDFLPSGSALAKRFFKYLSSLGKPGMVGWRWEGGGAERHCFSYLPDEETEAPKS